MELTSRVIPIGNRQLAVKAQSTRVLAIRSCIEDSRAQNFCAQPHYYARFFMHSALKRMLSQATVTAARLLRGHLLARRVGWVLHAARVGRGLQYPRSGLD